MFMRIFIGVDFTESVKRYFKNVSEMVLSNALRGNPTLYHHFHLTIKYIGEVSGSILDELIEEIEKTIEPVKPFIIRFNDMGSFVKNDEHTLWMGVIDIEKKLKRLSGQIESVLQIMHVPFDRKRFFPHVTLARQVILQNQLPTISVPYFGSDVLVDSMTLFKSHRHNGNLVYTPLHVFKFQD
jgi:2'-5' RNA ligase